MLRRTERREYAIMLAPYVIGITVLITLPALITFGLAVTEYDLIRPPKFNGIDNFRELWHDDIFRTAMRNSLMFILFAVPLRLMFWRLTLPLMAPTLLLLMFRDTIFSFQANFVPALIVTEGGPAPYATTYLPLFIYRNGFEYLRYGYAAAATLTMFLVTALIIYLQYRIVKRWRHAFVV
jgi:ABC-type sugar transport system permease subunit